MSRLDSQSSLVSPLNNANDIKPVYEYLVFAIGISWLAVIVVDLYSGRDFITSISFRVQDATWLPENVGPSRALIGLHHFGDFQIWLGYATVYNPYAQFIKYPPQSPPQLVWLFKALLQLGFQPFLGIPKALLGFWIASLGGWIHGLRYSRKLLEFSKREIRLYAACSVLSAPFIVTFDRGSLQFLVVASCLLFVHSTTNERTFASAIFFVIAVSLKPYCAVFLLWPISQKKWRVALTSTFSAGLVTLFALHTLPGSFASAINSFLRAITNHVSGPDLSWLSDSVSSPAAIWKLTNLFYSDFLTSQFEAQSNLILLAIGLTVFCAVGIIVVTDSSSNRQSLIVLFSSTQLIVPLSGLYTPLWAVALLPLLVRELGLVKFNAESKSGAINNCSALFSLFAMISLLPLPGSIDTGDYVYRYCALVAPVGMTLTIIPFASFVALESLRKQKKLRVTRGL